MNGIETIKLGATEYPLARITARRGLTAAYLIVPHIHGLRSILDDLARQPDEEGMSRLGIGLLMEALKALGPVLEPDKFLAIAEAVTGIPADTLGEAPLEDVLAATLKGVSSLDLMAIMRAGMGLFGQAQRLTIPTEEEVAPAEEPAAEPAPAEEPQ